MAETGTKARMTNEGDDDEEEEGEEEEEDWERGENWSRQQNSWGSSTRCNCRRRMFATSIFHRPRLTEKNPCSIVAASLQPQLYALLRDSDLCANVYTAYWAGLLEAVFALGSITGTHPGFPSPSPSKLRSWAPP